MCDFSFIFLGHAKILQFMVLTFLRFIYYYCENMQARVPWLASEGQSPSFRGHFSPFPCEFWPFSSSNSVWSSSVVTNAFICRPTSSACVFFTSFYLMLHFIFNQYAVEDEDNLDLMLEVKTQFSFRLNLLKLKNFIDLGHGLSSKEKKTQFLFGF